MKIKLIAPAGKTRAFLDWQDPIGMRSHRRMAAPLSLPILAGLTPSDIEIEIIDEYIEPIDFDDKVDLVGITFMTYIAPRAYKIATEFRKRGIPVILGGIHVSMLPDEALQYADSICIGEAEELWPGIIDDFKKQQLKKTYIASRQFDLTKSCIPKWNLLKHNFYNFHMLQTSRGCPFDCDFCCVKAFFGGGYRVKETPFILKEIELLKEIDSQKAFFINDDNILGNISFARKLFNEFTKLNIRWFCQSSINLYKFPDLIELMYKSGCRSVFIGFESISQKSIDLMNKERSNSVDEYNNAIKTIQSYGISVFGSFILGGDGDDNTIFEKTVSFINNSDIVFSLINILTPPPKTRLYDRLNGEKRIVERDWSKYDGTNVCFKPLNMSIKELEDGYRYVLKSIYAYNSIIKRLDNVWKEGLLLKNKSLISDLFSSKEKLFLVLKTIFDTDVDRKNFLWKNLYKSYNHKTVALSPLLMALSFHDFANF